MFYASCLARRRVIRGGKPLFYRPGAAFGTEAWFRQIALDAWTKEARS